MQAQKLEDRPPYVVFETRPEEDRTSSIDKGCYVSRDVDYAIITPMGSKDRIDRVATEWLEKLKVDAKNGRFPVEWADGYAKAYKMWKEGQEIPLNGTPIVTWPIVSPAMAKTLVNLNVRTVEDLAVANDETKQRIGMGAEGLKQKAINFLSVANSIGKASEELSSLQVETKALRSRNEALESQVVELQRQVKAQAPTQSQQQTREDADEISADDLGLGLTKL